MSVLLKSKQQPATVADIKVSKPPAELPLPVVSDGKILTDSLKKLGVKEDEVVVRLAKKGIRARDVFLMTLDSLGKSEIIKKGE